MRKSSYPFPPLAVLVPEYPLPSHTFIRREISCLRELGSDVHVFGTRPPRIHYRAPGWGAEAQADTYYLSSLGFSQVKDILSNISDAPWKAFFDIARAEGKSALRDTILCLPFAAHFAAECRRRGIQHIHAHMASRSALIAAIAAAMTRLPYSITHHGRLEDFGPNQRFKWANVLFGISITEELAAELREAIAPVSPNRLLIQPMGVDNSQFRREAPYRARQKDESFKVFSCGRLNFIKGHDILIEAVARLVASGENIRLEIAGGAGVAQKMIAATLKEQVRSLGLEEHVVFLGNLSEIEVLERLRNAHAFVLASRYEAFGVVYLEAMSCGLPTIGTRTGGVPEIIEDEVTGLLVSPEDPESLSHALERIGTDQALAERLSRAGMKRVREKFAIDASAKQLLSNAFPEDWVARSAPPAAG